MARAGAPPPLPSSSAAAAAASSYTSKKKEKEREDGVPENIDELQSKRLRDLSFSNGLLSRTTSHARHSLPPSKTILKSDGRDIVKRTTRKSKYLFSFPGLMAPVAGGKLGDLTNLDSKNPVLYVEFPEGRLKLFGTIVYPKNKYLTLHFQRGSGSVLCEDLFESLVVFSVVWWIGTKEQNPEESRLPLPKSLEEIKHSEFDFTAGAGQAENVFKSKAQRENAVQHLQQAGDDVSEAEANAKNTENGAVNQPSMRQSARTSGKQLKYAETSDAGSDSDSSDTEECAQVLKRRRKELLEPSNDQCMNLDINVNIHSDGRDVKPDGKTIGLQGAESNLYADQKAAMETDSKNIRVPLKTPVKGSIDKTWTLKQTQLDSFHKKSSLKDEGLGTADEFFTTKTTPKVSVQKNSAKRGSCKKNSKEEDSADSGSEGSMKNDSKEKKQKKNQGTAHVSKESLSGKKCDLFVSTKAPTLNSKISKEGTAKLIKEEKVFKGSKMKENSKPSESRHTAKRLKMAGNPTVELSDSSDEPSDDSDEDWTS